MSKVYFKKVDSSLRPNEISNYAKGLIDALLTVFGAEGIGSFKRGLRSNAAGLTQ